MQPKAPDTVSWPTAMALLLAFLEPTIMSLGPCLTIRAGKVFSGSAPVPRMWYVDWNQPVGDIITGVGR